MAPPPFYGALKVFYELARAFTGGDFRFTRCGGAPHAIRRQAGKQDAEAPPRHASVDRLDNIDAVFTLEVGFQQCPVFDDEAEPTVIPPVSGG